MPDPFEGPSEPRVVFEGPGLVAVYKPRRMHSAPGAEGGDLCAWVFERYPEAAAARAPDGPAAPRRRDREGGLLHRLDFETSGLVLFARDDRYFASLLAQQEEGLFLKEYLARSTLGEAEGPVGSRPARGSPLGIDAGAWSSARERRDLELMAALVGRARASGAESRVECAFRAYGPGAAAVACVGPAPGGGAGRGALYRADLLGARMAEDPGERASGGAVELSIGLSKGFRHQIRAQLAWIGLPIAGDLLYGGATAARLFLHASRVAFADPASGETVVLGLGGPESVAHAGRAGAAAGAMSAFDSLLLAGNSDRLRLHG